MNAIEIKNLTKSYKDFTLDNISLSLPNGSIMGLVGENGAGKSTMINLIMNAIKPDSGTVTVLGQDNQSEDFVRTKEQIGIVLDEAYFPEVLTSKSINSIMKLTYPTWSETVYLEFIKKFSLPTDKEFKDFSRGMKMKLAIAVALSHNPKLLILDEATSGLDPMIRDEVLNAFHDFTRDENRSILLSSHIVGDLEKVCDYIAFIHKGKLEFCEEKDRLLDEYALLKITKNDFEAIPKEAVVRKKQTNFGMEALVLKSKISSAFQVERTTLEDIILFLAKEEAK